MKKHFVIPANTRSGSLLNAGIQIDRATQASSLQPDDVYPRSQAPAWERVKHSFAKLKTRISNIWRKCVTSSPQYKLIKYRLKMLRKVLSRNNGVVLFEVIISNENYKYKILSSNLLTDCEISQAHGFIWKVLHDRVEQEAIRTKANSIINEANRITNVNNR